MKSFMKSVIVSSFLVFASFGVFAQCAPSPVIMGQGFQGGSPCWGGQPFNNGQPYNSGQFVQNGNQQWLANQAIRIPATGMPPGYCSWDERLKNVGLSALLGGIFGALIGRAAGQGAAVGLVVGTAVPCAAQQQYLEQRGFQQQQPQHQMGERYQGGNTVTSPARCFVAGEDFGDVPESTCLKIRDRLTTVRSQEVAQSSPREEPSANGCGVKLGGVLIKELFPREGSTCAEDKKLFIHRFMEKCRGKGGSDQADIQCGRRIDI